MDANDKEPPLWGIYLYYAFITAGYAVLAAVITILIIWVADSYWLNAELYEGLTAREQRSVTRKLFERIDWFYFPIVFVLSFAGLVIFNGFTPKSKNKK